MTGSWVLARPAFIRDPDRGRVRSSRRGSALPSYAREMAEAKGWTRLMTNSAKLVNTLGGYGYRSSLASLERCIDSAVAGRVL
jgi:hypothetical protein